MREVCSRENPQFEEREKLRKHPPKFEHRSVTVDTLSCDADTVVRNSIAFGMGHQEYAHAFAARGLGRKQISEVLAYIRTRAPPPKKGN